MRAVYLCLAFVFMALGAVGVVLPVLPTVPFLLLAATCFGKGSERCRRWFVGTGLYRRHLQSFAESRSMTLGTKLGILLPVTAMLVCAMILVNSLPMRIVVTALLLAKYYYFAFRIKTVRRAPAKDRLSGERNA